MSGMNLGTLLVKMNAETKALAKGMREGLNEVRAAAQAMKRLSAEVATAGAAVTGFFGGMVKAAASVDMGVKRSLHELHQSFLTLAVQIAHMVMPAVTQLSQLLRDLAGWFSGLPASTRDTISDFALFAVKAAAVGFALSKVAGLISGLMSLFSGLAGVMAAIGAGPLAAIVVGVGSLLVLVAVLHKAWRTNWNGIRDVTRAVLEQIGSMWGAFAGFLKGLWDNLVDQAAFAVKAMLAIWLKLMTITGKMSEGEAGLVGKTIEIGINTAAGMAKSPMALKSLALEAGKVLESAAIDVGKELRMAAHEVAKALGLASKGGRAPGAPDDDWYSAMGYSKEGHDRQEKDVARGKRFGGGGTVAKAGSAMREASAEFWKGMEDLGPTGTKIASIAWEFKETLAAAFEGFGAAVGFGANLMMTKMGELGQVLQSAVQGFQQGGWWGAIIAVFIELLSRFERFQEIIDIGNGQLKQFVDQLASAFNPIIDALRTFMGASGFLTTVVLDLLAPIFKQLGKAIESVVPLIMAVAEALALFQPIFDLIGEILGPIFEGIGYIMRFIGLTIIGTMHGLLMLWQGILQLVFEVTKIWTGGKGDAGIQKMMDENWQRILGTRAKMENLAKTGMVEVAKASADASEQVGKMADAAKDASEQLLNVPQGYKVAMDRFAAMAVSSTGFTMGSIADERRGLYLQTGNSSRGRFYSKGK